MLGSPFYGHIQKGTGTEYQPASHCQIMFSEGVGNELCTSPDVLMRVPCHFFFQFGVPRVFPDVWCCLDGALLVSGPKLFITLAGSSALTACLASFITCLVLLILQVCFTLALHLAFAVWPAFAVNPAFTVCFAFTAHFASTTCFAFTACFAFTGCFAFTACFALASGPLTLASVTFRSFLHFELMSQEPMSLFLLVDMLD